MMRITTFSRWLALATRGLPPAVAQMVGDELSDHYDDAVRHYRAGGIGAAQAHRAALMDLGSPHRVARAMRDIHAPRQRFVRAAIASMTPALLMLVLVPLVLMVNVEMLPTVAQVLIFFVYCGIGLSAILCTPYVLDTFRPLLNMSDLLDTPARIVRSGLLALVVPNLLTLGGGLAQPIGVLNLVNDPIVYLNSDGATPLGLWLPRLFIGGIVGAMGLAWLMASIRMARVDRSAFYGLYRVLRFAFFISGFGMLVASMSVTLAHENILNLTNIIIAINSPMKAGICALLFYRAARHSPTPMLLA